MRLLRKAWSAHLGRLWLRLPHSEPQEGEDQPKPSEGDEWARPAKALDDEGGEDVRAAREGGVTRPHGIRDGISPFKEQGKFFHGLGGRG